jgi:hypothetical protein
LICRLHSLWYPFKISSYLVPPIVFSLRAHSFFFTSGPCAAFRGMALTFHIDGPMVHLAAIWRDLRMFTKFKILPVHVKCWAGAGGAWTVACACQYRPLTGSIKPSLQLFQFWAFFRDSYISLFFNICFRKCDKLYELPCIDICQYQV